MNIYVTLQVNMETLLSVSQGSSKTTLWDDASGPVAGPPLFRAIVRGLASEHFGTDHLGGTALSCVSIAFYVRLHSSEPLAGQHWISLISGNEDKFLILAKGLAHSANWLNFLLAQQRSGDA